MNILIVEDLADDRRLLKYIIKHRGHTVIEAANGREALDQVRQQRPDLIVSDLLMPGLDGFGLLKSLKGEEELRDIPFIVYSSVYTGANEQELALAMGADGFLVKPLTPDDLWQGIEKILANLQERQSSRGILKEHKDFIEKYAAMVATRLEAKVRELQATQKKLADKERQYRCLFHSMEDAILVLSTGWEVLDANQPALRNQLGLELEEVVGRDLRSFFTDGMKHEELHEKICRGDTLPEPGIELQVPFTRKDQSVILCHLSLSRLLDEKEEVVGIIAVVRDVTAQAESEKKLRMARLEWEKTFDAVDDIVTLQGVDMRIKRINAAGLRILGKSMDELVGRHCYEVFRGTSDPCPGCPVNDSITDFVNHSCEIVHENLRKTFLVSAAPIVGDSGELKGIAHFAKDITERKALEKQLRQTQKLEAIGTLAGGIAHDFNNILSAILGYAQLLETELAEGSQARHDAAEIIRAGIRARDLVQQILAFSRSGEQKFEQLRIQSIVKEALKLLRASIPANIEIRQEIDEQCPEILGDATQIHQVMMNLCTNAYQAMSGKPGVLTVTLTQQMINGVDFPEWSAPHSGAYLVLEISDTGTGIEKRNLEKIFEPYFTTKAIGEGTGLGLSVVHGIIKTHGGHITVYSEPGNGTVFHVYLPVVTGKIEKMPEPVAAQPLPMGHERILLVDDEKVVTTLQQRVLDALGYTTTALSDSSKALEAFRSRPEDFDLLVTDLTMPGLSGMDLAKEIHTIRADMPVIMCSGFSNLVSDKKLQEAGIGFFLMKPTSSATLAKTVRQALDQKG